jgi:hypothetical protein
MRRRKSFSGMRHGRQVAAFYGLWYVGSEWVEIKCRVTAFVSSVEHVSVADCYGSTRDNGAADLGA